jgi:hypothetical protein
MEFVLICPTSSQPRFHKRAIQLNKIHKTSVFAFQRGLYEENTFSSELNLHYLGKIQDGQYFLRVITLVKAIFAIIKFRKKNADKNLFFYAMSFDCMMIAMLAGIKRGIYEVGDIRFNRNKKGFFSYIEDYLINRINGVVVTSPSFINLIKSPKQFNKNIPYYVIENKVDASLQRPYFNFPEKDKQIKKIRIGLIGFLRYKVPISRIINFVKENQDHYELHCWGDGQYKDIVLNNLSDSIFFYGSFKNPDQLEEIYSLIDLNYTVYGGENKTEIGVSHALPNKYYESAFFHIPIICRSNTEVGKKAKDNMIGFEIDISTSKSFSDGLLSISKYDIDEAKTKCNAIETKDLIEDGENILRDIFK